MEFVKNLYQNENEITEPKLYCKCREYSTSKSDNSFVGCDEKLGCLSRKERLKKSKFSGGDWFHYKCVGKNSPKKTDGKTPDWFCTKCRVAKKTDRSLVTQKLGAEKRKIVRAIPGKDNIFHVLCHLQFGMSPPMYLDPFKKKIERKLDDILSGASPSNAEKCAFEAVKSLLNEQYGKDFSTYTSEKIIENFQCTNLKGLNDLVIYIYGAIIKNDIYLLQMAGDGIFKWFCIFRARENVKSINYITLFKEKTEALSFIK